MSKIQQLCFIINCLVFRWRFQMVTQMCKSDLFLLLVFFLFSFSCDIFSAFILLSDLCVRSNVLTVKYKGEKMFSRNSLKFLKRNSEVIRRVKLKTYKILNDFGVIMSFCAIRFHSFRHNYHIVSHCIYIYCIYISNDVYLWTALISALTLALALDLWMNTHNNSTIKPPKKKFIQTYNIHIINICMCVFGLLRLSRLWYICCCWWCLDDVCMRNIWCDNSHDNWQSLVRLFFGVCVCVSDSWVKETASFEPKLLCVYILLGWYLITVML